MRDSYPRDNVTFYHGCIRAFDCVEPYHPDRVLRQFGLLQKIPDFPLIPSIVRRRNTGHKYNLTCDVLGGYFRFWSSHVLSTEARGRAVNPAWECSDDYMHWYRTFSHPIIQDPENISTAVGTTSTQAGPQPWEMIENALGYLEPVYQQWIENENGLDTSILVPTLVDAYRALNIAPEEPPESSKGASTSRSRRRRRS
ncbi:putative serine/threonine-protein phosphatase 7 long form-like protein [Iris pallida]|uniref:Serine/threonine-protein phosphatase 7 long form-like protein n=1 Tax=Iris pallida TaxID=29817 RepID=A0AAX6GJA8_IRIPA|nr:putative serine/threonine-protein phosphatase 7 long form-like protein [Iris pallida]